MIFGRTTRADQRVEGKEGGASTGLSPLSNLSDLPGSQLGEPEELRTMSLKCSHEPSDDSNEIEASNTDVPEGKGQENEVHRRVHARAHASG